MSDYWEDKAFRLQEDVAELKAENTALSAQLAQARKEIERKAKPCWKK